MAFLNLPGFEAVIGFHLHFAYFDIRSPGRAESLSEPAEIVRLIMDIRGYGPVKKETADKIRGQVSGRLANFTQITEKARKIAGCWPANRKKK